MTPGRVSHTPLLPQSNSHDVRQSTKGPQRPGGRPLDDPRVPLS